MSKWSGHSRRSVSTQRSAKALALGARIGVSITRTPSVTNTSSKGPQNFGELEFWYPSGCVRVMDAIADPDLPLVVSRSCTWTVEALGAISPDRKRPDVYDETSTHTHVLDALRYFMVNQSVGQQNCTRPGPWSAGR
jgi:hypothetical protein